MLFSINKLFSGADGNGDQTESEALEDITEDKIMEGTSETGYTLCL